MSLIDKVTVVFLAALATFAVLVAVSGKPTRKNDDDVHPPEA